MLRVTRDERVSVIAGERAGGSECRAGWWPGTSYALEAPIEWVSVVTPYYRYMNYVQFGLETGARRAH